LTIKLRDIAKAIDDYILDRGRNMASIETLENYMAAKFSTYKPAIQWKIKLMAQSGIIQETETVGVFKLIGSGRLKFLEKTDKEQPEKQPEPVAKKANLGKEAEDIDKLLGEVADDDSDEEIESDD
jgi:hypothetical protein